MARKPGTVVKHSLKYAQEDVDRVLLTIFQCGGNAAEAHRRLGKGAPPLRTIQDWRSDVHAARYVELATRHGAEIERTILTQLRENALLAGEVENEAILATRAQLQAGELKDASTAVRNLATSRGIGLDKILTLTGRPQQIHATRPPDEILSEIDRRLAELDSIDGTATELVTPELPAA